MLRTALLFSLLVVPAFAQDDCQLSGLVAPDASAVDWFGDAVAVDGTTAVVGARFDDDLGANSGSAYIFVYTGGVWTFEAKLVPLDGEAGDFFGDSVAISGDTLVVGARFEDEQATDAGAAYVFTRTAGLWNFQGKLMASDGALDDRFGVAVALEGDRAVIGAETHDGGALNGGAAYVFERSAGLWSETAKLVSTTAAADDYLGAAVALSGDRVVAGANGNDTAGSGAGSAVVFEVSAGVWSETAKLLADDPRLQGRFGDVVDVEGDTIVVGAPLDDDGIVNSGSAYVFELVTGAWTRVAKLRAPAPAAGDEFGRSLALEGETVLVGAPYRDDHAPNGGLVYQFERVGGVWQTAGDVLVAGLGAGDRMGRALAANHYFVLAGAPFDDGAALDAGRVRTFANPGARRSYGTGVAGTNGVPQIGTTGCIAADFAQALDVTSGPSGGLGLLVVGGNAASAPFAGGFVLVAPTPFLTFGHVLDGAGAYSMPFQVTPTFTGRSLFMQVGYLDVGAVANVALSAGIEVVFR